MDTNRGGRWLVSGMLGLAVLGTAGCGSTATPSSRQAGPAVVLNVPTQAAPSTSASAKAKPSKVKAETAASAPSPDKRTNKVPAAKPKSANETPDSPPSAWTP